MGKKMIKDSIKIMLVSFALSIVVLILYTNLPKWGFIVAYLGGASAATLLNMLGTRLLNK